LSLEFLTAEGESIRTFSTDAEEDSNKIEGIEAGFNQFVWNMRYPNAEGFDGLIMWAGNLTGPKVVPGTYQLRMRYGDYDETRSFEILPDPAHQRDPGGHAGPIRLPAGHKPETHGNTPGDKTHSGNS
jgi:hypothetical protein